MQLTTADFKKQLAQFIEFRGIDILLYLRDGSILELDKNRQIHGDMVIKNTRDGSEACVHIDDIIKADFYAA